MYASSAGDTVYMTSFSADGLEGARNNPDQFMTHEAYIGPGL